MSNGGSFEWAAADSAVRVASCVSPLIDWEGTEAYFEENPLISVDRVKPQGASAERHRRPGGNYERVRIASSGA